MLEQLGTSHLFIFLFLIGFSIVCCFVLMFLNAVIISDLFSDIVSVVLFFFILNFFQIVFFPSSVYQN